MLTYPKNGYVKLDAKVLDCEYNGVFTKYSVEIMGQILKYIEKNEEDGFHEPDEMVALYVNPKDIMQFKEG